MPPPGMMPPGMMGQPGMMPPGMMPPLPGGMPGMSPMPPNMNLMNMLQGQPGLATVGKKASPVTTGKAPGLMNIYETTPTFTPPPMFTAAPMAPTSMGDQK